MISLTKIIKTALIAAIVANLAACANISAASNMSDFGSTATYGTVVSEPGIEAF